MTTAVELPRPANALATLNFLDPAIDRLNAGLGHTTRDGGDTGQPGSVAYEDRTHVAIPDVLIQDARPVIDGFSLDKEGFLKLDCRDFDFTFAGDFDQHATLPPEFVDRLRTRLLELTGARHIWFVGANFREVGSVTSAAGVPARRVHCDYTLQEVQRHLRTTLGDKAEALLESRVQQLNIWKPLRGPVRDYPLTVCDASSLDRRELRRVARIEDDEDSLETWAVLFDKTQRWYYLPDQMPHEALVFKNADSLDDKMVAHAAFDNSHNQTVLSKRASVEIRAFVIY